MADALVKHHHDGDAELFGQVETGNGQVEALLRGVGAEGDDAVIAVGSPLGLHHVGLRGQCGQPGGGSAALHVDENARGFRDGGVADVLHHEREAGAGSDREGFGPAPNRALYGDGGGQFVLHLNEDAAYGGDSPREAFDHFRGRRDGITCGKSRTCCEGSLTTGVITVEKMDTRENTFGVSVHCELRR